MTDNPTYNKQVESSVPLNHTELQEIEQEYGFTHRQGMWRLIYAMITCQPDISSPVIKVSQYRTSPSRIHFEAVAGIHNCLYLTKSEGIFYWIDRPRKDTPTTDHPTCAKDNNYTPTNRNQNDPIDIRAAVDSDYANETTHRKSVTGISV